MTADPRAIREILGRTISRHRAGRAGDALATGHLSLTFQPLEGMYCPSLLFSRSKENEMATSYRVSGMTCQGCAKSVTNAIKAVAAEAEIEIDLDAKTVTVDGFDDQAAIGQAVKDAGYEFGGAIA